MKIGIISDVHNNVIALNAMLESFKEESCDEIVCCGDIIGIGPYPEETINKISSIKNIKCVLGNHDRYLIKGCGEKMDSEESEHHKWEHSILSKASKEFIFSLPYQLELKREGRKIVALHYCMNEDNKYINFTKNPSIEDCKKMFRNYEADIILYGHEHTSSIVKDENKYYINCGSLGCPHEDRGIARGGIIEISKEKVEFKAIQVAYDLQQVIEEIDNIQYPAYKQIKTLFYGIK